MELPMKSAPISEITFPFARSIADRSAAQQIIVKYLIEAVQYRQMDRNMRVVKLAKIRSLICFSSVVENKEYFFRNSSHFCLLETHLEN
jgi:hypothetical protein